MTTAAREQFTPSADGLIHVGTTTLTYSDESEERVFDLIHSCSDISSTSTEMIGKATDWAERYHTHPARANVIRAFDIPEGSAILEIGSGCGGVSRYLGEVGATLDALEPMQHRARVARERTRDLASVEVLVGEVSDLPDVASYDVVVVVGVLEYVGHGTSDPAPYVDFLRDIHRRLKPGGTLLLAIENQLGVKYFVGAPEDHTTQIFDGIEGYPRGERARTFSRAQLLDLFTQAGFTADTLAAFPDYKLTRAVLDTTRLSPQLLTGIPDFPSPDWTIPRPRLASERLVWKQFVDARLAAEAPNSFVVAAGRDGASALWPASRAAAWYGVDAPAAFATSTVVTGSTISRSFINDIDVDVDGFTRSGFSAPVIEGTDIVDALAAAPADSRAALLATWRSAITAGVVDPTVIITADGSAVAAPASLHAEMLDADATVGRALLWLGVAVASTTPPAQWPGATTVRDVVGHFGALLALPADWLASALAADAALQARISSAPVDLEARLNTPLSELELGPRSFEVSVSRADYQHSQNLLADAQREVERLRGLQG